MKHIVKSLLSLTLAIGAAGCNDFLSGPGVDQDPNSIPNLTRPGPLYIGIQAAQSVQFEGQLARLAAEYIQQVAGISRQSIGSTATAWTRSRSIPSGSRSMDPTGHWQRWRRPARHQEDAAARPQAVTIPSISESGRCTRPW